MTEVKESKITLPTYKIGEPNINPIIVPYRNEKSYPYVMRDELLDNKEYVDYKSIELENEYIKIIIIPEFGGKLYSAYDKRSKSEIFYRNNVVKPQLVGLTGAWTSGGVEWNFPIGHRPSTMECVDTAYRKNDDDSVSVFIGEISKMSGLRFTIELILAPEKAYIEEVVRIYNPTEVSRKYYLWNTASISETPKLEYRYPFKWFILDEKLGKRALWPFRNGMDLRYDSQMQPYIEAFADNFLDNFFGTYDEDTKLGLVHHANYHDVPGKKLWTWGHKEQGEVWNNILTDNDGPYVEVQSGSVETQEEFRLIDPIRFTTWKELWFQAYKTGPFTFANRNGILTTIVNEIEQEIVLDVTFSPNRRIRNAVFNILSSEKVIFSRECELSPESKENFNISIKKEEFVKGKLVVEIKENSYCILSYVVKANMPILEEIQKETEIHNDYNFKSYVDVSELSKALDYIRKIQYHEAEAILKTLWEKNEVDDKLSYYLGYVLFKLKKYEKAKSVLYYAGAHSNYYGAACNIAGRVFLIQKDYEKAEEFFSRAFEVCKRDYSNAVYYAYTLSFIGKKEEAEKILEDCLLEDPLNLPVMYELSRLLNCPVQKVFDRFYYSPRLSVEDILEVVRLYHQINDYNTALELCKEYSLKYSLLSYHKAYYLHALGYVNECRKELENSEGSSLDFVFPNKDITLQVLESLNKIFDLPKAKYLISLIYYNFEMFDNSIEIMEQVEDTLKYSVLNKNLGHLYWEQKSDFVMACSILEKGLEYKPFNPNLYYDLNLIYREMGEKEKRKQLLSKLESIDSKHQAIIIAKLNLYYDFKLFEEFFDLIYSYHFRNWEVETSDLNLRKMYEDARINYALMKIEKGDIQGAIYELLKAYEYPPNSGLGEKHDTRKEKVFYYLMLCYESIGELRKALEYAKMIIALNISDKNLPRYEYHIKAVNKLVELNWIGIK